MPSTKSQPEEQVAEMGLVWNTRGLAEPTERVTEAMAGGSRSYSNLRDTSELRLTADI